jgi:hypothetical protein
MKNNSEICVPLKALSLPGEQGGDVTPAVGDEVDITGTAKVTRIDGDNAYLSPSTINGEAVSPSMAKKEPTLDEEESEMREDAGKADAARLY